MLDFSTAPGASNALRERFTGPVLFSSLHDRPMRQAQDEDGEPLVSKDYEPPKPVLAVYRMGAIEGDFRREMTADDVVARVSSVARAVGAVKIIGDQYQAYFLTGAFSQRRLHYVQQSWTNETKSRAVVTLRRWFADQTIAIEPNAEGKRMRAELLSFQERIAPSGVMTYGARRGGHDDRVALLLNAAMAETEGLLRGSPHRAASGMRVIPGASPISRMASRTGNEHGDDCAA